MNVPVDNKECVSVWDDSRQTIEVGNWVPQWMPRNRVLAQANPNDCASGAVNFKQASRKSAWPTRAKTNRKAALSQDTDIGMGQCVAHWSLQRQEAVFSTVTNVEPDDRLQLTAFNGEVNFWLPEQTIAVQSYYCQNPQMNVPVDNKECVYVWDDSRKTIEVGNWVPQWMPRNRVLARANPNDCASGAVNFKRAKRSSM